MKKKNMRNTKGRIVSAAWHLFYEQGYENTTVDDIIFESETSKGSFYHYFSGKDSLLSTLSYLFDEKYEELSASFPENMDAISKLLYLNSEMFRIIEDTISIELLARLLSTQLVTKSEKHLLDKERTYYKLLRSIIVEGQENGEIVKDKSANDIVKAYAMYERALMYDWCLCNGEYSLREYSSAMLPMFISGYKISK
ncbi:MAG: TetR/AcrR family transcriptional regulator [Clostridia bacterium]|nr:TetR/AcrR family transcriptional regulator [Clostridia bacterium]